MCTSIYDAVNNRMVIFGGHAEPSSFVNDIWILQNANGIGGTPTWIKLNPTGTAPDGREWHSAVYCPPSNRMVIFGGINNLGQNLNDVWVLQNANGIGRTPTWIKLNPSGTALLSEREDHSAIYDAVNNRMVIFGGWAKKGSVDKYFNDVWVLNNANGLAASAWEHIEPAGTEPVGRELHTAVYDPVTNRMILCGGATEGSLLNDIWILINANGL
jgi:hypothetical protein